MGSIDIKKKEIEGLNLYKSIISAIKTFIIQILSEKLVKYLST